MVPALAPPHAPPQAVATAPYAADADRWRAVRANDRAADGHFIYAVTSTGIYCRPHCPSRQPKRANVRFFRLPESARAAGFRPCKRCRPDEMPGNLPEVAQVRQICAWIAEADMAAPLAGDLAARAGLGERSLRRLFLEYLGLTPRQYWDALRVARLKASLRAGEDIAGAGYGAGYGAASRLYSAAATNLGMTPATYGKGGAGADITYAVAAFDIGHVLLAATATGVCFLGLDDDPGFLTAELRRDFPAAELARDDAALAEQMAKVAAYLNGGAPHPDLPLDIRWTAFQHRVWRALTTIPPGQTRTYRELAAAIGAPGAARAVGTACARNPVSLVVPCHRAVGSDGALRGYRWGLARKRQLLRREGVDM
ncbi:MAG: bifunctional DNA-binding transcriptional regulator/O6-methylguanine-DNA methyltransferase Ada [Alphaproteobacteria bacterium]|nr:bifunctional DNA-binding transcriptional regulator/O6-methylguanine-DNA methyltransferase Ada [Alphaproteobacteria bacterium]